MQIRTYLPDDRTACLNVFRSNVPAYFAASDEAEFARFLDDLQAKYWVVDVDGQIRACGGLALYYPERDMATLCWGMVARNFQRQGIGKVLLEFRMGVVATQSPSITRLRINTTQVVQVFYERRGFAAVRVEPGGYGPELDHVVMDRVVTQLRI
jgi:GNAT superfamily N-acetyltransferase